MGKKLPSLKFLILLTGLLSYYHSSKARDYEKVYLDLSDSTKYYYKVTPEIEAKGLLILLPGSRGNAEWPLKTTKIPYVAADSGLVTIMIDYQIWLCWLHEDVLNLINKSVNDVISEYNIPTNKCVIGGFSGGGNMALSYTELAYEDSSQTAIKPCGVFALQPPLDLTELYSVDHQIIEGYYCIENKEEITEEVLGANGLMTSILGTPWENPENYYTCSPFLLSRRYQDGGKAIFLKDVPVRVYEGYNEQYFTRKINNCGLYLPSELFFISFLRFQGNGRATLKNQYDEDYHPDGGENFRGRHAWSGFDSQECVEWIMKTLNDQ